MSEASVGVTPTQQHPHPPLASPALSEPDFGAWPRMAALVQQARARGASRTGVVYPLNQAALSAALLAHQMGLIEAVLYAPTAPLVALAQSLGLSLEGLTIVDAGLMPSDSARAAVRDCLAPRGLQALMKGSLHTDEFMAPVVAREGGLRGADRISHVFVFDLASYPKWLMVADAVVNIAPDLRVKQAIVRNAVLAAQRLGIVRPKVAVLAAVEEHNPAISATVDATELVLLGQQGAFGNADIDGPLGMDNAVSPQAARTKGLGGVVAGEADILLAPDLNAGNILYKSLVYLAGAQCAGVVLGAKVPLVLTSRADSVASRVASCALANVLTHEANEVGGVDA